MDIFIKVCAIIGILAIAALLALGVTVLIQKADENREQKNKVELLEFHMETLNRIEEQLHSEVKALWQAVDDINKRLRDAEKET